MRYCPICEERYEDEVIKFCTKDGTPLVEEKEPSFTALPSEELDDEIGQETVIRRREDASDASTWQGERIVIPAVDEAPQAQQVRPRAAQPYYPPPPPQVSTGKTVVLTILGTLGVLGFGAFLFWLLQGEPAANLNVNTNMPNVNVNLNSNTGFDSNFNFNTNANFATNYNINTNLNANIKTPTPTATPKPSPSITPSPSPSPTTTATPRPSPSPTRPATNIRPANTPRSSPAPTPRIGPRPPGNTNN
jgi:hypothetical protein